MKNIFFALLFLILPLTAFAQQDWDQGVEYQIDVDLDTENHQYAGHEILKYTNNSPDQLDFVFFHLYFNAFQPNSMMAERNRTLPDADGRVVPKIFNYTEDEMGWHKISSIKQDGQAVTFDVNDTVMKVMLAKPLMPGETTTLELNFMSQIPLQTRRSGWMNREGVDYSMTQWYPKMAAYDARGWHADPYVGREFYAPFGTFNVNITLPAEFLIGSSGIVQNGNEVGHGYGADPNGNPEKLTWKIKAEKVHDFAWVADPDFVHETVTGPNGVQIHLVHLPEVTEQWAQMSQIVPTIMHFYNQRIGDYAWPSFTVAQGGDGGMEYPQIILITGNRSIGSLVGVTAHEMAHEWFYGALASNEADFSWMDEGFTSYFTSEATKFLQSGDLNGDASHIGSYYSVMAVKDYGLYERINTPADWFHTNMAYGVAAYSSGEMLMDMLGGVIGEDKRDEFVLEYYRRFKLKHPTPLDVEKVAEDVSGIQLDWFFEQFTNTNWQLDYEIANYKREGNNVRINLERNDRLVMPLDVQIIYENGDTNYVNIPTGEMQGAKAVPADWTVEKPWLWTSEEYSFTVTPPAGVKVAKVVIDPNMQMPDHNRLNNSSNFPYNVRFMKAPSASWQEYGLTWRPALSYSSKYGTGVGIDVQGNALFGHDKIHLNLLAWAPVGGAEIYTDTTSFDFDYLVSYETKLGANSTLALSARRRLNIYQEKARFSYRLSEYGIRSPSNHTVFVEFGRWHQNNTFKTFNWQGEFHHRTYEYDILYNDVQILYAQLGYQYTKKHNHLDIILTTGGEFSKYNKDNRSAYNSSQSVMLQIAGQHILPIGKLLNLRHRFDFRLAADLLRIENFVNVGYTTYKELLDNDAYLITHDIVQSATLDFNKNEYGYQDVDFTQFHAFSGVGPVGYNQTDYNGFAKQLGKSGIAATVSLETKPFNKISLLKPLRFELFVSAGEAWRAINGFSGNNLTYNTFTVKDLIFDAGLGVHFDLGRIIWVQNTTSSTLKQMHLVAKFPLWLSKPVERRFDENNLPIPPESEPQFDFRWMIGIQVGGWGD